MPSVRVLDSVGGGEDRKFMLWGCVGKCNLFIWKIETGSNNTFYLITGDSSLESIAEEETLNAFKDEGFEIIPPPEVRAARTIIAKQIDNIYKEAKEEDYERGISLVNCRAEIKEIVIIPTQYDSPMIKIRFSKIYMAEHALNHGIKIFEQLIPPRALQKEVCTKLDTCTNCFGYNHIKPNCPKPVAPRCTNCAREGHRYYNCPGGNHRCLNCGQGHPTFSRDCERRKALLKEKTRDEIKKENDRARTRQRNYEDKKHSKTSGWDDRPGVPLPADVFAVIITALVSATMIESKLKGTFQSTYDDVLDHHSIPRVSLPQGVIEQLVHSQDNSNRGNKMDNFSTASEMVQHFPDLDNLTTETEGEAELITMDDMPLRRVSPHGASLQDTSTKKKKKCKLSKRKRIQTPPSNNQAPQAKLLHSENENGADSNHATCPSSMDEEVNANTVPTVGFLMRAGASPLDILEKEGSLVFPEDTPPPKGTITYTKADTSISYSDISQMSKLQFIKPIIFYPITWKLDTYQILMKFLDGETYIYHNSSDKNLSTRKLIRNCLAEGDSPQTVINFAGINEDEWKDNYIRLYGRTGN